MLMPTNGPPSLNRALKAPPNRKDTTAQLGFEAREGGGIRLAADKLRNNMASAMRSESRQKETPGPLNRKRSRKGFRGQRV